MGGLGGGQKVHVEKVYVLLLSPLFVIHLCGELVRSGFSFGAIGCDLLVVAIRYVSRDGM